MTLQAKRLERDVLALFHRACRCGRLDIAEHLLSALETFDRVRSDDTNPLSGSCLKEAYGEICRMDEARRKS